MQLLKFEHNKELTNNFSLPVFPLRKACKVLGKAQKVNTQNWPLTNLLRLPEGASKETMSIYLFIFCSHLDVLYVIFFVCNVCIFFLSNKHYHYHYLDNEFKSVEYYHSCFGSEVLVKGRGGGGEDTIIPTKTTTTSGNRGATPFTTRGVLMWQRRARSRIQARIGRRACEGSRK